MVSNPKEWLKTAGAIAGLIVAAVEVAQYVSSARTALDATYQPSPFFLPLRLQERSSLDTATLELYKTANRLYYAYYDRLTLIERQQIPDSLKRPTMPSAYYYGNRVEPFASHYNSFGTLHIQNDGDKSLGPLQILHGRASYYEYKDSNGHLQNGESTSRFSIGELVSGESRDIKLWTSSAYDENTLTITYPEGKVKTLHTEVVSGIWASLARDANSLRFLALIIAGWGTVAGGWYVWARLTQRRQAGRIS